VCFGDDAAGVGAAALVPGEVSTVRSHTRPAIAAVVSRWAVHDLLGRSLPVPSSGTATRRRLCVELGEWRNHA
jgi:hypothetical protein